MENPNRQDPKQQEMAKLYEQYSVVTMKNRIGNLMEELLNLETALRIANAEIEKQKEENQKLVEEINKLKAPSMEKKEK